MLYFTSDTHFGYDSKQIFDREYRDFSSPSEYADFQIGLWNSVVKADDTIYALGDFANYNKHEHGWYDGGIALAERVNAHLILIMGNNEGRIVHREFDGDFEAFRSVCMSSGFDDVKYSADIAINGVLTHLCHKPVDADLNMFNLFGHIHSAGGAYRPCGFNVGVDVNHYRLVSEERVAQLIKYANMWYKVDADMNYWRRLNV